MSARRPALKRLSTAARWPVGIGLTSWRYLWRTTPVHRRDLLGWIGEDAPPALPAAVEEERLQRPEDGAGPLVHRLYRTRIRGSGMSSEELMEAMRADLDELAPSEFVSFQKVEGANGRLAVGDEYVVRMPGPWDGPVRVVATTPSSFRLATLEGHLEAGQIEFRASSAHQSLEFVIESWARSGDRLSDLLYTHLRMSKEVQLHMWTSVLERVVELSGGRMWDGIAITTRRVEDERGGSGGGLGPRNRRARRRLAELAERRLNYEHDAERAASGHDGWHLDDVREPLPHEPSGHPVKDGSWEVARELMCAYQVADPDVVRATYRHDAPLAGRDMLLQIRFLGLRLYVGVRVGEVYDETREVDGRSARVFGWGYGTLEGHFEQGQMHYEVWKWLDSGDVEFRLHAFSRAARSGPPLLRLGFRLVGRREQLDFYRHVCRRVRRLTVAELETRRIAAYSSRSPRVGEPAAAIVPCVPPAPLRLIEFPADDPERARRFWSALLDVSLESRTDGEGEGWQTRSDGPALGIHARGPGPGDTFSLPYFAVADLGGALERVRALGGTVVHPGSAWAVCKDSEGSPFGLAQSHQGR